MKDKSMVKEYLQNHSVSQIRIIRMKKGAYELKSREDAVGYFEDLRDTSQPVFRERKERDATIAEGEGGRNTFLLFEFDKSIVAVAFMSNTGPSRNTDKDGPHFKYPLDNKTVFSIPRKTTKEELSKILKINMSVPFKFSKDISVICYPKLIDYLFRKKIESISNLPIRPGHYEEGGTRQLCMDNHERNPQARKACIAHYGYACCVCGFNFEERYGRHGTNYIHVHHLALISKAKEKRKVDPVKDLRPICANCHAMIHREKKPLSIKKLKDLIEEQMPF